MKTIKEFYKSTPIKITDELWHLYDYFNEYFNYNVDLSRNEHIELRYYADELFNDSYVWRFISVWFKHNPVMLFQQYSDSGQFYQPIITNKDLYVEMMEYVRSLSDEYSIKVVDENSIIDELTTFNQHSLSEFYDPILKPKYKKDDIVVATVKENHLRDAYAGKNTVYIQTRCMVTKVNPFNPTTTYHLAQLDRRFETKEEQEKRNGERQEVITDKDKGNLFALFAFGNDSTIVGYYEEE